MIGSTAGTLRVQVHLKSRGRVKKDDLLSIGEVAIRSGFRASAIRYYESIGLLGSDRSAANQRRYSRHVLRRLAFIRAAQRVGLSLEDITSALSRLPIDRAPNKTEWARLSRRWRARLNAHIAELERLRDDLTGCIGCGCLSLATCRLYNPEDAAAANGAGARFLLGDDSRQFLRDGRIEDAGAERPDRIRVHVEEEPGRAPKPGGRRAVRLAAASSRRLALPS
jgi:MerR family transcriptional regulator, redox-sensitive transcriptional activator SoxR